MSQGQPQIIEYDANPPSRWRRIVPTSRKLLVALLLVSAVFLIVNCLPPFSTKGWRACSSCARRERVASTLCGLSRTTVPIAPGPLETYFIRTGTPCPHTWTTYITEDTYPWFGSGIGRKINVGTSPTSLIDSAMRLHTVSDAEVAEALNLAKSNDRKSLFGWQARIGFRSPPPTTLPPPRHSGPLVAKPIRALPAAAANA